MKNNEVENPEVEKISMGGVKSGSPSAFREKEWYRGRIVEMVGNIKDEKFLSQIHTILKRHIEKREV